MPTTRARASLRIGSATGPSAHVTHSLALTPTHCHEAGEPRSTRDPQPWSHSHWALESRLPDSSPLEDHLADLCDRVEPRAAELHRLARDGYDLDWFCFLDVEGGQGSVALSPSLLTRLGALPVELVLDIYG